MSDQCLGQEAAAAAEVDITTLLQGKLYEHLLALQRQIQAKLSGGGLLISTVWKSKVRHVMISRRDFFLTFPQARLKSLHKVVVRNHLEQLRK